MEAYLAERDISSAANVKARLAGADSGVSGPQILPKASAAVIFKLTLVTFY
jgi:hypothetical protein